ncbi:MAG: hypothetical protein WDZ28_03425 [Simkaniaceae bacterium]
MINDISVNNNYVDSDYDFNEEDYDFNGMEDSSASPLHKEDSLFDKGLEKLLGLLKKIFNIFKIIFIDPFTSCCTPNDDIVELKGATPGVGDQDVLNVRIINNKVFLNADFYYFFDSEIKKANDFKDVINKHLNDFLSKSLNLEKVVIIKEASTYLLRFSFEEEDAQSPEEFSYPQNLEKTF